MHLLLIGCGNLGKIFLKTWLKNYIFSKIVVVDPNLVAEHFLKDVAPKPEHELTFCKSPDDIPTYFRPNYVVIVTKPQVLPDILHHYRHYHHATFISLAASITTTYLKQNLEAKNIIRIIPNVAAQIGESVNLAFASAHLTAEQKTTVATIFAATGKLIWLEDEKLLDLLTSVASSGSAYVFLFIQSLVKTAMKLGLDAATANAVVKQMVLGSALLAMQHTDLEKLITAVTSKGGLTEAALKVLDPHLTELIDQACAAANARLIELQK